MPPGGSLSLLQVHTWLPWGFSNFIFSLVLDTVYTIAYIVVLRGPLVLIFYPSFKNPSWCLTFFWQCFESLIKKALGERECHVSFTPWYKQVTPLVWISSWLFVEKDFDSRDTPGAFRKEGGITGKGEVRTRRAWLHEPKINFAHVNVFFFLNHSELWEGSSSGRSQDTLEKSEKEP